MSKQSERDTRTRRQTYIMGFLYSQQEYMNLRSQANMRLNMSKKFLRHLSHLLGERDYKVMKERWIKRKSLEECGRKFGVSRERVRQLELRAFKKMRKELGKPFLESIEIMTDSMKSRSGWLGVLQHMAKQFEKKTE